MRVLVTGSAGFIGFHATRALMARGHAVTGMDELNAYYDPALKLARLAELGNFSFIKADIAAPDAFAGLGQVDAILHLAAQAGVRYALQDPAAYTRSNLVGHHNVLEFARRNGGHLVYASSSSVYGNDTKAPFGEDARADRPVSYYGATKRANELMSHSYAELFGLPQTGLRFFTVYGPWGRPDMAYWLFTERVLRGEAIPVFGEGKLRRDFTYIDDIVEALVRIVETPHTGETHKVYNLGNSHPETVTDLIAAIESATGRHARLDYQDGPPGDVVETYADISRAARDYGFAPKVKLRDGIGRFVAWYRWYQKP